VTSKYYCYVDETGLDTRGDLFIVAVVVIAIDRDEVIEVLESIERKSGKGRRKWIKTRYSQRELFMQMILDNPIFEGLLTYKVFYDSQAYTDMTIQAAAKAIQTSVTDDDYHAVVLVDALSKSQVNQFGVGVRNAGVRIKKVRGIRKEESDALLRLADSLCGFTRSALKGDPVFRAMLERALRQGYIRQLE
jgi:hypothetical protein